MAQSQLLTLTATPLQTFGAVIETAGRAGFEVTTSDRESGHLLLNHPYGRRGRSHHFNLSVTDNGVGGTTLIISWRRTPRRLQLHSESKTAGRLCKRIRATVEGP